MSVRVLWRDKAVASRTGALAWFCKVFLPEGFPQSVTSDYLRYQYYDTTQALCSSLVGTLATAGMLRAAGVGDAEASALGAMLTFMLGDGVGMVTKIVFAWLKSSSLDAFSKQYRLLADVANDAALFVGIVASKEHFLLALVAQNVLRSVVAVAGSATRAAVVVHQAHNGRGNVSDVAAKDGSQETLVNLMALLLGYVLIPIVISNGLTWFVFVLLTCGHIGANYKAVTSLRFVHLNPFRLDLLIDTFQNRLLPSVEFINAREPIWPHQIWRHKRRFPSLRLGVDPSVQKSSRDGSSAYMLGSDWAAFARGATNVDMVRAYFHLRTKSSKNFAEFVTYCQKAGFDFERLSLCVGEYSYEAL